MFISAFLNSVYGWTAQNSVINSKNFVQRIFFELLYRVYKISKFLGQTLYECPSIKYAPLEFYTPCCLSSLGYLFDDPFTNNVRMLSSIPRIKKTLWKLFCFVSYLRKSLSLTFLFSDSLLRVKYNVWGLTYFWALVGTIFLPWLKLKQSSKRCSRRHFSKYYQIIPEHFPTITKVMQKLCFAAEFCICISNRIPCVKVSSSEANCKIGIFLTGIWISVCTCVVELWLNKSAT